MNHWFVVLYNLLSVKTCKKPASVIIYLYLSKKTNGKLMLWFWQNVRRDYYVFYASCKYETIDVFQISYVLINNIIYR